jgi:hypothetical protein
MLMLIRFTKLEPVAADLVVLKVIQPAAASVSRG